MFAGLAAMFGYRNARAAQLAQEQLDDYTADQIRKFRLERQFDNEPTVVFSAKHPEGVEGCRCCGAHLQRNGM